MEARHRQLLQSNRANLVKELDPSKLYDGLLSRGVFTQDMIDEIQSCGTRLDQARQLVRDLETRGRGAFSAFLECLVETGQGHVAAHLRDSGPVQQPLPLPTPPLCGLTDLPRENDLPPQRDTSGLPGKSQPFPTTISGANPRPPGRVRRDSVQNYKMDADPCGLCLIINNVEFEPQSELKNRRGSDIDCERMERRFKSFNFIVVVKKNLKQRQIKQELSALSKRDHSKYDCCVVIVLSHGTEASHNRFPGAVYGVDGPSVPVEQITSYLNGHHCPSLQGKPKLFFIQACGGDERDTGFEVSPDEARPCIGGEDDQTDASPMSSSSDSLSVSDEPDARTSLPTPSDILVSYSTYPGYVSWRDPAVGSWYVETLDNILESNADTNDLVTMLMMVNNEVSQITAKGLYKQMPGSFNFLRKHLYFSASQKS